MTAAMPAQATAFTDGLHAAAAICDRKAEEYRLCNHDWDKCRAARELAKELRDAAACEGPALADSFAALRAEADMWRKRAEAATATCAARSAAAVMRYLGAE